MDINGLVLESKHAEYLFLIKGPLQKVWRDGFPVDESQIIPLQFDRYICEVDLMAQNQEWNTEQREAVANAVERQLHDRNFKDMWVHVQPSPPLPWPTYNETHHNQIPVIAKATGMVIAALAYEQRGRDEGPRPSVVEKLQELLEQGDGDTGETTPVAQSDDMVAV